MTLVGFFAGLFGVPFLINTLHSFGNKHLTTNSKCAPRDPKAAEAISKCRWAQCPPLPYFLSSVQSPEVSQMRGHLLITLHPTPQAQACQHLGFGCDTQLFHKDPTSPWFHENQGGDLSLHRGASGRDCEYSCLHWLHQWRDVMLTALTYKPRISMASHDRCLFAHLHISQAGEPSQRESFLQVVI